MFISPHALTASALVHFLAAVSHGETIAITPSRSLSSQACVPPTPLSTPAISLPK